GYGPGEEGGYGGEGGQCDGSCGDAGCNGRCGRRGNRLRHGIATHLIGCFLPYDDGGCCAPHWFDAHVEYVNLRREDVSDTVNFMSAGPLGPIVLSTNDLEFENQSGFRATLSTQLGVGSNVEFSYLGQFNWSSSAQVTDPGNGLFSAFSQFGVIPNPGQGFTETDQASFASIAYSSSIDNFELNFRHRWQGYGCRLQGSWLAGVRYFQLKEQFIFTTLAPINNGSMEYDIGTLNQMTGFQIGGDVWACLLPGFSVGAEGKVGIYGNDASQQSLITATTVIPPLSERVRETDAAFLAEAGLMANWRVSQSWTFRGGYQFLYVNGVALAPENFNATPPFLQNAFVPPTRVPVLNTGGDVFYHGLTAGFEYMW
ncbi:MAG TPA: BBP7 family outer membrane beta-barrel protein, partial [Pirellulaceae bacterium]|nr:BBP7 family outer membrane beta-barrel protein [Pirellulaceae bacterium]